MNIEENRTSWIVVGEGRKARFYLTHWHRSSNSPDMPRFSRGAPSRAKAMRYQTKLEAERAAAHCNEVDHYDLEWHAVATGEQHATQPQEQPA